jgi:ABC-2 type transport system permease protein
MPLRIATGVGPVWQVVLAAVLLVAAVWGVIRLAGAIYARSLLHRGSRITWRQALRLRSPRRRYRGRSPVASLVVPWSL